jgi:hypothetical protein
MDYNEFHTLFLTEMPVRLNGGNPYEPLCQGIDITIEYGGEIESLGDNVFKVGDFYWFGSADASVKQLCINTTQVGKLLKVNSTGKSPDLAGSPPYAIDLYLKIASSLGNGIKFASDQVLSDDGFKVWSRIFTSGHKLLIFNSKSGKYEPVVPSSIHDLEKYFNDDGIDYQYVIDESANIGNLIGNFTILEWKRLSSYPLEKLVASKPIL